METDYDDTQNRYDAIRAEYYRLVKIEQEINPQRARHIGKRYYVELIAQNPTFNITNEDHIQKIINRYYERRRRR